MWKSIWSKRKLNWHRSKIAKILHADLHICFYPNAAEISLILSNGKSLTFSLSLAQPSEGKSLSFVFSLLALDLGFSNKYCASSFNPDVRRNKNGFYCIVVNCVLHSCSLIYKRIIISNFNTFNCGPNFFISFFRCFCLHWNFGLFEFKIWWKYKLSIMWKHLIFFVFFFDRPTIIKIQLTYLYIPTQPVCVCVYWHDDANEI